MISLVVNTSIKIMSQKFSFYKQYLVFVFPYYRDSKVHHFFLFTSLFLCTFFFFPSPFFYWFLFLIVLLPFHIGLGLGEVIEDYVHNDWARIFCYLCVFMIIFFTIKYLFFFFFVSM